MVPKFFSTPSMFAVTSRTNSAESRSAPAMRTLVPHAGVEHLLANSPNLGITPTSPVRAPLIAHCCFN